MLSTPPIFNLEFRDDPLEHIGATFHPIAKFIGLGYIFM